MSSITSIALSGMTAADTALQTHAHNIANLDTPDFRRQAVQQAATVPDGTTATVTQAAHAGTAMETDVVGLLQAKNSFLANLAVFKTGDRMIGALIDAVG